MAAPLERVARTMRHIAISGASRRLGAALAQRFAAPGTRLFLTARGAEALTKVAALCQVAGAEVEVLACDIRDPASLAPALLAFDDAAPVDLIIANAGTSSGSSLEGEPEAYGAGHQPDRGQSDRCNGLDRASRACCVHMGSRNPL